MQGNQDLVRVCSQPVSSWSLSSGSTIFKDNILISGYFSFFPILPRLSSSSPPKGWHSYIAQELKNIPPTLFVFLCCAQRLWPKPPLGSQGSFFKVPPPSSAFVFSANSLLGRVSTARQAKLKFHYRCLRVSSWPAWEKKKIWWCSVTLQVNEDAAAALPTLDPPKQRSHIKTCFHAAAQHIPGLVSSDVPA